MKTKKKQQKTIAFSELVRLSFCNSKQLPPIVEYKGRNKEWVGIGWIDIGPADGKGVLVVEDKS